MRTKAISDLKNRRGLAARIVAIGAMGLRAVLAGIEARAQAVDGRHRR